ncbi:MAG: ion transporter, partial [Myxococcota bacterium]
VIVVISMPVLFSSIVDIPDLSALLVLRIGRLFRLFRMMRFVPNQEHLYRGIKRALRASVGVFAALFLVNLILSIGATQLFGRYAPQYFGDPAISSYSLFRVFTIEGWYEIPDAVASASSAYVGTLARLYFMASVLAGGILGLSLANAVFVDEITMDNNEPLERKVDRLFDELAALRQQLASPSNESAEPNGSRRASGDDHE